MYTAKRGTDRGVKSGNAVIARFGDIVPRQNVGSASMNQNSDGDLVFMTVTNHFHDFDFPLNFC